MRYRDRDLHGTDEREHAECQARSALGFRELRIQIWHERSAIRMH